MARAGGALDVDDVARILGISRQAVDERRRAHRLIAVPQGQVYVYPAAQFGKNDLIPGLDQALEVMPVQDPWMRLEWLLTADDALGGMSPLEVLQSGHAAEAIANAAGHGA